MILVGIDVAKDKHEEATSGIFDPRHRANPPPSMLQFIR